MSGVRGTNAKNDVHPALVTAQAAGARATFIGVWQIRDEALDPTAVINAAFEMVRVSLAIRASPFGVVQCHPTSIETFDREPKA
jgi:hypothetical protein